MEVDGRRVDVMNEVAHSLITRRYGQSQSRLEGNV